MITKEIEPQEKTVSLIDEFEGIVRIYRPWERNRWHITGVVAQKDAIVLAQTHIDYEKDGMYQGDEIALRDSQIEIYDWEKAIVQANANDWNPMRLKLFQVARRRLEEGVREVDANEAAINCIALMVMVEMLPGNLGDDPKRPVAA